MNVYTLNNYLLTNIKLILIDYYAFLKTELFD